MRDGCTVVKTRGRLPLWAAVLSGVLALVACGDGSLETVTTFEGICTLESRLAVLVTVLNPDGLEIDSVTATRAGEQNCFLESGAQEFAADDAGESGGFVYSCWEQGKGTYVVKVKSGAKTWTESVDVPGNDCHITKMQNLMVELF